jgi:anti-sigma factor RsiW
MTIDPEIIKDLLPLYRSGLASPASRRLVEAWLAEHSPDAADEAGIAPAGSDEAVLRALDRARRLRRRLRWLFGLAIGLTVFCASMEIRLEGGLPVSVRLLAVEMPLAFAPAIAAALACWTGYFVLRRRLR